MLGKIKVVNLKGARQTGKAMHKMAKQYASDMAPWAHLSLIEIFDTLKALPYYPDPQNNELVKRPYYTMVGVYAGGDCDDKAVALASWAILNGIPYRFIGVGRRTNSNIKINLTHVYPMVYINSDWIIADATYNHNVLGANLGGYDRMEIL